MVARQLERARKQYPRPALETAGRLGFVTELGVALCFDIHVQNGGVKRAAMATIDADAIAIECPGARHSLWPRPRRAEARRILTR